MLAQNNSQLGERFRQPVRGHIQYNIPDVEPELSEVRDFYDEVSGITPEEIEWAYEQGANSIEEVVEIVSTNKRGEHRDERPTLN